MNSSVDFFEQLYKFDFSASVKTYDFTKQAVSDIRHIVKMTEEQDMNSGELLQTFLQEIRLVPFGDYLKRYLYRMVLDSVDADSGKKLSYTEIDLNTYRKLIMDSFYENHAPYALTETLTPARKIVTRWLTQQSVNRSVVMCLGFGLRMRPEEVSHFLQKALLEEDFNPYDPEEVIYWYCFDQELPYAKALHYLELYKNYSVEKKKRSYKKNWFRIVRSVEYKMNPEHSLLRYLERLKSGAIEHSQGARQEFLRLYDEVREAIVRVRGQYSKPYGTHLTMDKITPVDIEKELYAGVPRNSYGNMKRTSMSLLTEHLGIHFLSRQRITKLLNDQYVVRRYDLITLCFYIHASESNRSSREMFLSFVKDINERLTRVGMRELYPANPYESFLILCLLSEMPLVTYSDMLESSFHELM